MILSLSIALMLQVQTIKAPATTEEIHWMSFEEAIAANAKVKKKIFIDVYTKWCGWCKVMDSKTFTDSTVAAYMNANYYCVKFDAETRDTILYNSKKFTYIADYKSNELAIALLNGQMSYPSFVVLTESEKMLTVLKGYQEKTVFMQNMQRLTEYKEK